MSDAFNPQDISPQFFANIGGSQTAAVSRRTALMAGATCGVTSAVQTAKLAADERAVDEQLVGNRGSGVVQRVIFLFMNGGPSQLDTFDPKPALKKYDGQSYSGPLSVASGTRTAGTLWASPFEFSRQGESGLQVSELFPHVADCADDLCVIRSMQSRSALHAPAMLEMNTGRLQTGAASLGAWIDFGLGVRQHDLPACMVLPDHRGGPIAGHSNWNAGALPVSAATMLNTMQPELEQLREESRTADREQRMRTLLRNLNQNHRDRSGLTDIFKARQRSSELAWRMRHSMSETMNLAQETLATQMSYGLLEAQTRPFGTQCLVARRLIERGTRFVQIYSGGGAQKDTWDSHTGHIERHQKFSAETDRPIAALLKDLKQTGLWKDTLVIWGGEFGRTPTREASSNGRDHNPHGFSMWLAGGPVKGGHTIGATDELGLNAVANSCSVADLHATVLHLLGLDHSALQFYHNGVEVGLTGPEPCRVIDEVLV